MIITKTPFRMSFFGGGTDMEEYFRKNEGAVLSTTFDKYCYVNVRHLPRFFDYSTELSYSKTERVTNINDIQHPAIREAMKMLDMREIRLTYEADLPARSGLVTSSSFAVGMLNAFYALKGKYADKKKLADEAIYLERVLCNESGGWQDQIAASFGGFNRINFNSDGYEVLPVIISPERKRMLNDNLLMFFTGFTRFSSDVQKANKASSSEDKSVEEVIRDVLNDDLERILIELNRTGELETFLRLLGMHDYLGTEAEEKCNRDGKIIVIGQSEVGKDKLAAVAKKMGIAKDRFEFLLDYKDAKTFDFRKTQWSSKYSYILAGPMPHSGVAKGEYGSIISAIESEAGYPPVVKMGTDGLKITKTSFRNTLKYLLTEKKIA